MVITSNLKQEADSNENLLITMISAILHPEEQQVYSLYYEKKIGLLSHGCHPYCDLIKLLFFS
jgi:hypothetical protein